MALTGAATPIRFVASGIATHRHGEETELISRF